jgi:hypothetical protein
MVMKSTIKTQVHVIHDMAMSTLEWFAFIKGVNHDGNFYSIEVLEKNITSNKAKQYFQL